MGKAGSIVDKAARRSSLIVGKLNSKSPSESVAIEKDNKLSELNKKWIEDI